MTTTIVKRSLVIILVIQAFFTVNFGIVCYGLLLILTQVYNFPIDNSYAIVAIFLLLNGALHFVATYLGQHYLDYKKMLLVCLVMMCLSNYILSKKYYCNIYFGLTIFTVAYGLIVTCINILVKNYLVAIHANKSKTFSGFSYNALSANIGILLGTIAVSFIDRINTIFAIGFICSVIAILIFIWNYPYLVFPSNKKQPKHYIKFTLAYLILSIITYTCFIYPIIAFILTGCIFLFTLWFFIDSYQELTARNTRSNMRIFIYLLFFSILFWITYNLIPLLITYLTETTVNLHLFGGLTIHSSFIGSLNTIIVVVFLALLPKSYRYFKFNYFKAFLTSYILAFFAFATLFYGIYSVALSGNLALWVVIIYILLFSLAEVFMQPLGYSYVELLITQEKRNYMIGAVSFLISGFAPIISGLISDIATPSQHLEHYDRLMHYEFSLGYLILVITILICCLLFLNKKAMRI